jgi:hypothetical protein
MYFIPDSILEYLNQISKIKFRDVFFILAHSLWRMQRLTWADEAEDFESIAAALRVAALQDWCLGAQHNIVAASEAQNHGSAR